MESEPRKPEANQKSNNRGGRGPKRYRGGYNYQNMNYYNQNN